MVVGISEFLKQKDSFIRCFRLCTWQNLDLDFSVGLELKSTGRIIRTYCDASEPISLLTSFT